MYLPNWANILNHQLLHSYMFTKIYITANLQNNRDYIC